MSYHPYYRRLRIKSVQTFDRLFARPGEHARCHKRIWKQLGCYIFGVSYECYLEYLKIDVSDIPEVPSQAVRALDRLIEELLARERTPVRIRRTPHPDAERIVRK